MRYQIEFESGTWMPTAFYMQSDATFEDTRREALSASAAYPIFRYRIVNVSTGIVCPGVYIDGQFHQNESEYQEVEHVRKE